MEIAMMIAGAWHMNIFDVLKQDIDTFIMVSNFLIKLGDRQNEIPVTIKPTKTNSNGRIRVNDKTATGGWF